jgi:hypothetical protein
MCGLTRRRDRRALGRTIGRGQHFGSFHEHKKSGQSVLPIPKRLAHEYGAPGGGCQALLPLRLRKEDGFDQVLLIAMTGYGQDDDRRRSREARFDDHLVKPIDLAELEALLRRGPGRAGCQALILWLHLFGPAHGN